MVTWRSLVCDYAVVDGIRLRFHSQDGTSEVFVSTDSPQVASRFGLASDPEYGYCGWLPYQSVTAFVEERWYGVVGGQEVVIRAEVADEYVVLANGGPVISRWKMEELERGLWEGNIPKSAFSRVWSKERTTGT